MHFQNCDLREGQTRTRRRRRERARQGEKRRERERESMSGCHQTRRVARRGRTWLACSRSGARARTAGSDFHHGGSWARTISESKKCFLSVSVSVSVSAGAGRAGQSPRRDSQALCLTSSGRVLVFLCDQFVSNSTSLVCLLEPRRRQASAILARPEQSRRLRVGLPTLVKSQKTHRETLTWCSLPSNSSHPRAFSHYPNNRISKPAHRRSQPLHWTSHRMVWFCTGLLGTTRSRLLPMPWVSTSQPGTMRHHSQGTILTLTSSLTLN